ncbi:hypothetical protein BGZ61DRAFT_464993 [Ilyonectria robusta]|uniref:uncharacterized protein n=1 Tax=Ilyonectria robusta TaxID=1079257 RepID=UPI001E8EB803|nr:uncharacterized protein BGZ61DRAFT_464993 [Ilyonectria robusta]KAH8659727.1 hypothetical protein BGZ61DRAFT_464993 [Ilyonectria robusta]
MVVVVGATGASRVVAVPVPAPTVSPSELFAPSLDLVSELVLFIGEVAKTCGCEGANESLHPHRPDSIEEVARP